MLLLDDVNLLYRQRDTLTLPEFLRRFARHVNDLQYQPEKTVRHICKYLREEMTVHSKSSLVYTKHRGVISKAELVNKDQWYIKDFAAHAASTGGSTSGEPFHYLRWADIYNEIEGEQHYRAILKEFNITQPARVLYLMLDQTDDRSMDTFIRTYQTANLLISHGQQQRATIHEVIKNRSFYNDYYNFYEKVIKFTAENDIDIILAPGNVVAALTWNIRRLGHTAPICKLLSNTGEKAARQDLDYLKSIGIIENWCDHMRCWDGGVTFYTCRHNTYHLIDGLAWAFSDKHQRLISTDFFSLPSPFVNYWNGDYCTISNDYQRCRCGRIYRQFSIDRTRNVAVNGIPSTQVRTVLSEIDFFTEAVKRAEMSNNFLRIFTRRPLTTPERQTIRNVLRNFEINFVTEHDYGSATGIGGSPVGIIPPM
jgi:hypothetical protein